MAQDDKTTQAPSDAATTSRRDFLRAAAVAGAGFMIVPRRVLGRGMTAPSDLVNIATVGINGQGATNTVAVMSENIVAICDCDLGLLEAKLKTWHETVYPLTPRSTPTRSTPTATSAWKNFGPTPAQKAADAKWTMMPQADRLQRLPSTSRSRSSPSATPTIARCSTSRRISTPVIVMTPYHMHAAIASAAMDMGKHILRAEAALLVGRRSAPPWRGRQRTTRSSPPRWATRGIPRRPVDS